jgi:hypothetical protein
VIERRANGDLHRFDLQVDAALVVGRRGTEIEVVQNREPDLRRQSLSVRWNFVQFDVAILLPDQV